MAGSPAGRALSAPGASAGSRIAATGSAVHAVQCPGAVPSRADILSPDDHLVTPETGQEMLDGQVMRALPALPPHGDRQCDVSYVIRAFTAPAYVASTELLTRTSATSDFATDACIRRRGIDPATGNRYLEELSFEIKFKQSLASLTRRAETLEAAGVRRVFAIHVAENPDGRVVAGPVEEWRGGAWVKLASTEMIEDACLVEPMQVGALIDALEADKAVARALIERENPVLADYAADSYRAGESDGYSAGKSDGRADMLRQTIGDLCDAYGIEFGPDRRARITAMTLGQLERLRTALKTERRWPA